jgi:hypothetical protein
METEKVNQSQLNGSEFGVRHGHSRNATQSGRFGKRAVSIGKGTSLGVKSNCPDQTRYAASYIRTNLLSGSAAQRQRSARMKASVLTAFLQEPPSPTLTPSHNLPHCEALDSFRAFGHLLEMEVAIRVCGYPVDFREMALAFFQARDPAQDGTQHRQFRLGKKHLCAGAETVGEIASRCRQRGGMLGHTRLISHTHGATGHPGPGAYFAIGSIVSFRSSIRSPHCRAA